MKRQINIKQITPEKHLIKVNAAKELPKENFDVNDYNLEFHKFTKFKVDLHLKIGDPAVIFEEPAGEVFKTKKNKKFGGMK